MRIKIMDDEQLNMNIRKYLKKVGVNSQREIENAVRNAIANGRINGDETLAVSVTLSVREIDLNVNIDGDINLN
jgi:ribosomal protein L1